MQRISIRLGPADGSPVSASRIYRLANFSVAVDRPLAALGVPLTVARSETAATPHSPDRAAYPATLPVRKTIEFSGWLVDAVRSIVVERIDSGYRMRIERAGVFLVDPGQARISVLSRDDICATTFEQVLIGPPLILLMACLNTFCLHGSAVRFDDALWVFLGASGAGKSTLATVLNGAGLSGVERQCDDIVPVGLEGDAMLAYPNYPQLKLAPGESSYAGIDTELAVRRIYLIERCVDPNTEIFAAPVDASGATLALVRHTVAARLFDNALVSAHLEFAARASAAVPVARLRYPDGIANLSRLIYWVAARSVGVKG